MGTQPCLLAVGGQDGREHDPLKRAGRLHARNCQSAFPLIPLRPLFVPNRPGATKGSMAMSTITTRDGTEIFYKD